MSHNLYYPAALMRHTTNTASKQAQVTVRNAPGSTAKFFRRCVWTRGLCFLGVISLLSACAESLSKADKYAVEACGLEKTDDKWSSPNLNTDSFFTYNDRLSELKAERAIWEKAAPAAAAAAQEDSSYEVLATSTSALLAFLNDILASRAQYIREVEFWSTRSEDMFNTPLSRWRSECAGLSVRLNG